jgi:FkbM family methyltransferase
MWSLLPYFAEDLRISILDVGAALLERPPYQGLVDAGRARVLGFEPDAAACERLNQQFGAPHRFFPVFAGDGRHATFHETNWSPTGSLYEPNTPMLEMFQNLAELMTPVAQHPVQTTPLDDLEDIDDVDFVKIDVQGSELAVLRNATRVLSGALLIQTEVEFVEMYKGQPMFADVDTFLRGAGFQFHTFSGAGGRAFKPMVINGDVNVGPLSVGARQFLWADACYVRDWRHLDALSDDKLAKYAVLAHDLLQSFDLAHLALMKLDHRNGQGLAERYMRQLADGTLAEVNLSGRSAEADPAPPAEPARDPPARSFASRLRGLFSGSE